MVKKYSQFWTVHEYRPRYRQDFKTVVRRSHDHQSTWRPLEKARRKYNSYLPPQNVAMSDQRGEVILRNLAHDLLTDGECEQFKLILHQFKQTQSVTSLCQRLRPLINTTEKLLLLVELSSRIPKSLQEDFHRICSLQFKNYETYLRIYTNGNAMSEIPRVIAQDSSGKFKIVSKGSEKKFMVNYNNYKNSTELNSQHGTSVTSGIYSEHDEVSIKHLDDVDAGDSGMFTWARRNGRVTIPSKAAYVSKENSNTGTRRVFLRRRDDGSLGLGIDGGKEYGREITVSVVDPEGPAADQGLVEGDRILEVNGTDFRSMTHAEAVTLMRNAWNIIMMVQSGASRLNSHKEEHAQIKDLELLVYPCEGRMGCSTNRRNKNKILVVNGVDQNSPAEKAGIEIGDCITKIDGIDIRSLSEIQITSLTRAKRLLVNIKRLNRPEGHGRRNHTGRYYNSRSNERASSQSTRDGTPSNYSPSRNRSLSASSPSRDITTSKSRPSSNTSAGTPSGLRDVDRENENDRLSRVFGYMDFDEEIDQLDGNVINNNDSASNSHRNPLISSGSSQNLDSMQDNNWVLSQKTPPKMFHRRGFITAPNVITNNKNRADSHAAQFERRSRSHGRDIVPVVWTGGVRRYVRSRSQSPHYLQTRRQRISRKEQDIMAAIQIGIEKRQRALRLSLYQTPDSNDLDWEM